MKDMLGREQVISPQAALDLLIRHLPPGDLPTVDVSLDDALGLICASDVVATEDLPGFSRSTVDGYALQAQDTFGARETMPAYLSLSGEVLMGSAPPVQVERGMAVKIPTGGMLPSGADAVVMFEHVQAVDDSMIEVLRPAAPGENVIQAGEDVTAGTVVLRKGRRIRPQDIAVCAGTGNTRVSVYQPIRVAIISTGDEIVASSERPAAGQVRDINSWLIASLVKELGGIPLRRGIVRDDYGVLRSVMEDALKEAAIMTISGGTSVGIKDMVARIISDIGSPGVLFHGLSLKPGKPMIGGVIEGVPVLGLPGHPAAVGICCDLFLRPLLKRLSGFDDSRNLFDHARMVHARLAGNIASSAGREEHVRVFLEEREDGLWAVPIHGKSGLITTLSKADGIMVIPVELNGIEKGEMIAVRLL